MDDRRPDRWTIRSVLAWTRDHLAGKGVGNPRLETEWILAEALGVDRVGLYLNFDKPLNDAERSAIREMVSRRARREPLQYILGSQEFAGLDFTVTPAVLIPRYDTELLLEEAASRLVGIERVLEIGTGSGCLAISLASRFPGLSVTATDISSAALSVARENARRHAVTVRFLEGDLFSPVGGERFSLILSNPPYIPTSDIPTLEPEVREYEPLTALDGGVDGLSCYRRLIPGALTHLTPGGWLLVEIGIGEGEGVRELFASSRFCDIVTAVDTAGRERVVIGRAPTEKDGSSWTS